MVEVDWLQAAVEAPLACLLALFIIKCYRSRVRLSFNSPCFRFCGVVLKMEMPGNDGLTKSDSADSGEIQLTKDHADRAEDIVLKNTARHLPTISDLSPGEA